MEEMVWELGVNQGEVDCGRICDAALLMNVCVCADVGGGEGGSAVMELE